MGCGQRAVHVPEEELGDDAQAPGGEELEQDLKEAVVLRTGERDLRRKMPRPVKVCRTGHRRGCRFWGGGRFGVTYGGRAPLWGKPED